MKKLTLGLCIVSTTATALAHNIEYKVCKGDTLAKIASKFHVTGKAILHANDLTPDHHMRPGHFLLIPRVHGAVKGSTVAHAKSNPHAARLAMGKPSMGSYKVQNGDQDWTLAKRNGMSLHALHLANPGVDWDHLKIGLQLHVPSHRSTAVALHTKPGHGHPAHSTRVAFHDGHVHMAAHWHKVEDGENDWIIAHKAHIRLPLLKQLNPEIDVSNVHPGQKIRVPGSAVARLALRVPRIHSTHVAINGDNVSIRSQAGVHAETITTVDAGLQARVVDRDGNWYQLKFPKGTVGWVRGDLLKPVHMIERVAVRDDSDDDDNNDDQPVVHHHRQRQMEAVRHVAHIHPTYVPHHSTAVAVHHHHSSSHRVEHVATSSMTALDTDDADASGVLKTARSMRGARYRWGAMSRGSTDCSGFTSQVMRDHGIHLPRVSRDQATMGVPVDKKDLKPGDLVFFHTGRGSRITHVAIFEGNGRFIHASSGGGHVQENSLSDGYYAHHYARARRVLKGHKRVHHDTEVAERAPEKRIAEEDGDPKPVAESKSGVEVKAAPTESKAKSSL